MVCALHLQRGAGGAPTREQDSPVSGLILSLPLRDVPPHADITRTPSAKTHRGEVAASAWAWF